MLDNPLREIFGTSQVTKTVTGVTGGYQRGSTFGFALDSANDAFDTTFVLTAGQTFTSEPIRVGVPCTVTETAQPAPLKDFVYRAPVFTPDPPPVTIAAKNQVVTVDVANPIAELVGELVGDCGCTRC